MDYNRLKSFITVAESNNLSIAAKTLRRKESAITHQVKKLEEELQTKLFERIGKHIVLTPEGQQIFELGKQKLGEIDLHVDRVLSKGLALEGMIRIGIFHDYSTPFSLYPFLGHFKKKYPKIQLEIHALSNEKIERRLMEKKLDIGLVTRIAHREEFDTIPASNARLILTTSREYLERKGPFPSIDSVLEADLIDSDLNFYYFKEWLRKHYPGKIPQLVRTVPNVVVPDHLGARSFIENGFGIALLPEHLIQESTHKTQFVQLLPQIGETVIWQEWAALKLKEADPSLEAFKKSFQTFILR